ncbi:MFS transporter [Streptomyces sp. NPDC002536]
MTASTLPSPRATGRAAPRLALVLLACCLGQFMNVLDASVVNVALPSVARDLHFGRHSLQWVNTAYTVAVCGFLLLGGRLADIFGQRRVFLSGVALFTLASSVGGAAGDPLTLVLARAFQGLGAAVMAPATLTVLGTTFTEPDARARAFGLWSAVSGSAGAIGVLVGGVITQWFSWRWTLLVNVPIGIVLLGVVYAAVPDTRAQGGRRALDVPGALTVTLGLIAAVHGVAESHTYGWGSLRVVTALTAGVVLLALFVLLQAKVSPHPLVPLGVFRNRAVTAANLVAFFGVAALFSTFYFCTLVLQQVMGYSPLRTGLGYLPLSLGIAVGGWRISSVVPRTGPRPVLLAGLAVSSVGLLWLSRADEHATFASDVLGPTLLLGLGMGAVLNATTNAATSSLPAHQAGLASGLLNTTRQLGSAVGLVLLATLASARTDAELGSAAPGEALTRHALASGYSLALLGAALFAAAGIVAALALPVRTGSRASRGDKETLTS